MKRMIISLGVIAILLAGGIICFRYRVYYSVGPAASDKVFVIKEKQRGLEIASGLEESGLVSGKWYLVYYLWSHGKLGSLIPGEYDLPGGATIPEIADDITKGKEMAVRITFPEGWTAKQMADRLNANGLPGDDFLRIVNDPGNFKKRYDYLNIPEVTTLEGYLFPDTYSFKTDISAENIIGRLLDNFDSRLSDKMREDMTAQGKKTREIVIMASLLEKEVQTPADMKLVAGIFYNRLRIGQRLQSDATLSYALGDNDDQHSGAELDLDSPYNTYRNAGLPPGPISNPGLNALEAAVYPQISDYNYFLTATVSGQKKVFYARTYDEHLANKQKAGL